MGGKRFVMTGKYTLLLAKVNIEKKLYKEST